MAARRAPSTELQARPSVSAPSSTTTSWTKQVADLLQRVDDADAHARRGHDADIPDLAAGFAVERRLVEQDEPLSPAASVSTGAPPRTSAATTPSACSVS
jgi:hypothetical protein